MFFSFSFFPLEKRVKENLVETFSAWSCVAQWVSGSSLRESQLHYKSRDKRGHAHQPTGNRFFLSQPNCAPQRTHQALIGAIGHRCPEGFRFFKCGVKIGYLEFSSKHVHRSKISSGCNFAVRKCSCTFLSAVPCAWGRSRAARLAEQHWKKQSVERRKSSPNSEQKDLGFICPIVKGLYPHFVSFQVKPVGLNAVGEKLSNFSELVFKLLSAHFHFVLLCKSLDCALKVVAWNHKVVTFINILAQMCFASSDYLGVSLVRIVLSFVHFASRFVYSFFFLILN